MKSLLYVPTDRPSEASVVSYAAEAQALADAGTSSGFALIESEEAAHVAEHASVIDAWRYRLDVPLIHLDLVRQQELIGAVLDAAGLVADDRHWVRGALMSPGTSYSAGPNKAALLACALGVSRLHRRDSDTTPQLKDGQPLYPSVLEDRFLERRAGDIRDGVAGLDRFTESLPILCVGTDYQGAGALDRDDFIRLSTDLIVDHERIENPTVTAEELTARVQRKYLQRDQTPYVSDRMEIDQSGRSEMGAFSVARLFRLLPEMPLGETLGTDYFVKNLAYRLGLPVIYHTRRVSHSRAGPRNGGQNRQGFLEYALKDSRFKLLKRIWRRLNLAVEDTFYASRSALDLVHFDAEAYAGCAELALQLTPREELVRLLDELADLYRSAGALAARSEGADPVRFLQVADRLSRDGAALIDFVRGGFLDFARLVRIWPQLTAAAETLVRQQAPWSGAGFSS